MQIDPTTLSILGIVFVSSFIRSAFGFGDALVSMPILVMLIGLKTATPPARMIANLWTPIICCDSGFQKFLLS